MMEYREIRQIVRNLRNYKIAPERIFWQELRDRKLDGKKINDKHG